MRGGARRFIIVCMAANAVDRAAVLEDIRTLAAAGGHALERVEHALTDGYACALEIETERLRLERRLHERAGSLSNRTARNVDEVEQLAKGLARADEELAELRSALKTLAGVARRLRGDRRI
jgi:hypothetical protein